MDFAILHYTQGVSMTWTQYDDDLYTQTCKVADFYDESTLNETRIERVGSFICHSLRKYWALNRQANLTDIAFWAQSLVRIHEKSSKSLPTGNQNANAKKFRNEAGKIRLPM